MAKQIRLTRKRLTWAESRGATIKGEKLTYPAAASQRYDASLKRLIRAMTKEYEREAAKLFREFKPEIEQLEFAKDASLASQASILFGWLGKKYAKLFASRSKTITESMLDTVSKSSMRTLGESLKKVSGGITIPMPELPSTMEERLKAATIENVGLIKSIAPQYHERIRQSVMRSIQTGGRGSAEIMEDLKKIGGMSDRRAENIATDQTRKATTAYNVERAKSVGVKKFEWLHSGGGAEPRKLHVEYDGRIFDYDNPPIIDPRTGERGFPGQAVNCRCTMVPVLSFGEDE